MNPLKVIMLVLATVPTYAQAETVVLSVTNPGFETGDGNGWNLDGFVITANAHSGAFGAEGGQFDSGSISGVNTLSQTINVSTNAAIIDTGLVTTNFSFWFKHPDAANEVASADLRFIDGSGAAINTYLSGDIGGGSSWSHLSIGGGSVPVPAGTRSIELTLRCEITGAGSSLQTVYDDITASLTSPDITPPTITGLEPADGVTNGIVEGSLTATFDEGINLRAGGTITITDIDDGSGTQVITLLDASQVTVAGNALTINPATALEYGTNYEITIDANAVEDLAATPNAYPGTSAGEWNFMTRSANVAPAFSVDPIIGSDATQDAAYSGSVAGAASDDNGDPLTYAKVSGPAWLNVAADGSLTGTPGNSDVGANSFIVSASDSIVNPVEATLNITVNNVNDAPFFTSDPIEGPAATEIIAYSGTLADFASDIDGDPLIYTKVSGPVWLAVAEDGTLTGTPDAGDLGLHTFTVNVSDGIASPVEATLNITVSLLPRTIAYWQMDEASGDLLDAVDSVGSAESLTSSAGLAYLQASVAPDPVPNPDAGPFSSGTPADNPYSIDFSGLTAAPSISTPGSVPFKMTQSASFTFEGWIRHNISDGTHSLLEFLGGDGHSSGNWNGWQARVVEGRIEFSFDDGTSRSITGTTRIDDGQPHHFAIVWDHELGVMRVFVDGNLEATSTPFTPRSYTQSGFSLGAYENDSDGNYDDLPLNGHLDELRFSNTALKPSEFTLMSGIDSAPPVIQSLHPSDDSSTVYPWTKIVATFNEPITLRSGGTVTVTDLSDDSSTQVITLPDPRVTSRNGYDLTVDFLGANLEWDQHYSVRISADAIEDQASNTFAGVLDDQTWDFQTKVGADQLANVLIVTAELADALPNRTIEVAENTMFHDAINVDDAMRAASYGQFGLHLGDGSGMDATVELYFPDLLAEDAFADGNNLRHTMQEELMSMGYNLDNYRFILYLYPQKVAGSFAGAASIGGTWSVYKSFTHYVIMHELGHCLGGNHSQGDPGCALGGGPTNYNAVKKIHFGWMDAYSGTVVDVTSDTSLTLAPLGESPASQTGMRSARVAAPDGSTYNISYRVSEEGYRRLNSPDSNSQKVFVSLDIGSTFTLHEATLGEGESFTKDYLTVTCESVSADGQTADISFSFNEPTVNFNPGTATIVEGPSATGTATVELSHAYHQPVLVDHLLASSPGTAQDGIDYNYTPGTLTFNAGETSKTFTFDVIDNSLEDGDRTVLFDLAMGSNALAGTATTLTYTILNEDGNGAPAWNSDPLIEAAASTDLIYNVSLADKSSDPEGDPLTYTKVSGPDWLAVAADGTLSGSPSLADLGTNAFIVTVQDLVNAPVQTTLEISVVDVNDSPSFSVNPIVRAEAIAGTSYADTLASTATDPDGDPIIYAKVDGPGWLAVAADGTLSGTPSTLEVGSNAFTVSASDGTNTPVQATLEITVLNPNSIVSVTQADAFGNNLDRVVNVAVDIINPDSVLVAAIYSDGLIYQETLRFGNGEGIGSGDVAPDWVATDDRLHMAYWLNPPTESGLAIRTSNTGGSAAQQYVTAIWELNNVDLSANIIKSINSDSITTASPYQHIIAAAAQNGDTTVSASSGSALNIPLRFDSVTLGDFGYGGGGTLSAGDALISTADTHSVDFDGEGSGPVSLAFQPLTPSQGNTVPIWSSDPIIGPDATEGAAYSHTLANSASDTDGDTLSFVKVSGPVWLAVAGDGTLSGIPTSVGDSPNVFVVSVSDGSASPVEATLHIKVQSAFDGWADSDAMVTFSGDSNADGMPDGLKWLLGASGPSVNADTLLPSTTQSNVALSISFRALAAGKRGSATLHLQHSNTLMPDSWTSVEIPTTSATVDGIEFIISPITDTDLIDVEAKVPDTDGPTFFRLMGELP